MERLVRVSPAKIPQHIIQRENNHQVCFGNEIYMKAYLNWLKVFSNKHKVSIHAWVLMTNHENNWGKSNIFYVIQLNFSL